jgi:predicted nucleotide-binding protein
VTNRRKPQPPPNPVPKLFASLDEIERGVRKLARRGDEVRELLDGKVPHGDQRVDNVAAAISDTILDVFGPDSPEFARHQHFSFLRSFMMNEPDSVTDRRFWTEGAPAALQLLEGLIARLEERKEDLPRNPASVPNLPAGGQTQPRRAVFIGHGRRPEWLKLKEFLKEQLGLGVEEYNAQAVAGIARQERLKHLLDSSGIAFLVLTAEDRHTDDNLHARENVIHEVGLFQGRLGFRRAIVLLEEGCSEFSNIEGLEQLRFPRGRIDAEFEHVRQVLRREGFAS